MSKKSVIAILVILLAAAFAGCIGDDVEPEEEEDDGEKKEIVNEAGERFKLADTTQMEEDLGAIQVVPEDNEEGFTRPNVTRNDWLLLSTPVSAEGKVAAFKFEFPKQALMDAEFLPDPILLLDFAPATGPMGQGDTMDSDIQWLFMVLYERLDQEFNQWEAALTQERFQVGTSITQTSTEFGGSPTSREVSASSQPFTARISYDPETVGDNIYFILAAKGESITEFGMGVRMLGYDHVGQSAPTSPTPSWGEFENATGGKAPYAPERTGAADGLFLGSYHERYETNEPLVERISRDMPSPSDTLPREAAPITTARDVTLGTSFEGDGWSRVNIFYFSIGDAGSWSVEGNVYGEEVSESVNWQPYDFADPTPRLVRATVTGEGGVQLENSVTKTGSPLVEELLYEHYSIGGDIEEFTGLPYKEVSL